MHIFKEHENKDIKIINQKLISNLQTSELIKENDNVLDFGCGQGIWDSKLNFFHKLILYDKNSENREFCKKKYSNSEIINDVNEIEQVNVIFINSVIQYMSKDELRETLEKFANVLVNDGIVIISDIPKYNRILEYMLTFFSNFSLFKLQTRQLLSRSYRKTEYYLHSINDLSEISKKRFTLMIRKNFDINSNRYSVVLKKININ